MIIEVFSCEHRYIKIVLLQSDTSSGDLLSTLQSMTLTASSLHCDLVCYIDIEDLVNAVMIPESSREVSVIPLTARVF